METFLLHNVGGNHREHPLPHFNFKPEILYMSPLPSARVKKE